MTHPGLILADELKTGQLSQRELSKSIGMLTSLLNETIKGKRPISPTLAIKLGSLLIGTASYWVHAQAEYDLYQAKVAATIL